jgi:gamma-glutamyltranspeptidase
VLESRLHEGVERTLAARGHQVELTDAWSSSLGHAHAIEIVREESGAVASYAAASDPRCEGSAAAW